MENRCRATLICLSVLLICFLVASVCTAESFMELPGTDTVKTGNLDDNQKLLEEYIRKEMYSIGEKLSDRKEAGGKALSTAEQRLYDKLQADIKKVAAGEKTSTVFSYNVEDIYDKTVYTKDDLGVNSLLNADYSLTQEAKDALNSIIVDRMLVLDSLLFDFPYEFYWFDKTEGVSVSRTQILNGQNEITIMGPLKFSFRVSVDYAKDGQDYECDPKYGSSVKAAVSNAKKILDKYNGKSDKERLLGYAQEICDLVSYNYDAANDENDAYGNPSQLIWVFDGDMNTNVVCEGYSKAFQYLCDLSAFSGNTRTITVSGWVNNGPHMWNIVRMNDGVNYMADITHVDAGSDLMLVKSDYGDDEKGYAFLANDYIYYYQYDSSTKKRYNREELILGMKTSEPEPAPEPEPEPAGKVEAFITRCYRIILGRQPDAGGLQTWYNELTSGRKTASEIIDRFVNSPEYLNKNYNYGDSVDILYQAMLGRNADAAGKANWVKKLENGQTLAHVINGFCFSNEFRGLCDSYGIKAGFVNIPNADTTAEGKIKAFVQRCYRIILDREADPSGMQTWYEQLSSGKKAAAEIIDRFVNSPEFSGKNYNSSDSVEILYKAMLGRGSDAAGKANWVGKLDAGQPFAVVINGFCVSKEFTGICDSYGIKPGSVTITPLSGIAEEEALSMLAYKAKEPITKKSETNPTRVEIINPSDTIDMNIGTAVQAVYINEEKAKEFIGRCYRVILGREASTTELENWIGQVVNGTKTPDQIARGFLFSNEFKAKNVSSEELVRILYRVYMNRDADPEGLKTWTEKLDNGTSLKDLLDAFAKTNEFKKVVSEMGQ